MKTKEEELDRRKKYYQDHKEHLIAGMKEYSKTHHDKILSNAANFRKNHKEEISKYHKEYYQKNRDNILKKYRLKRSLMTEEEKEEKRVWDREVYNIRKYKEYMKEKI